MLTSARTARFNALVIFHYGNGGWVRVDSDELGLPGRVYFRMQEVDGELRLTELYLDGRGSPIPPRALRQLPLQALEHGGSGESMRTRMKVAGPDLSRLAAHFASTF